MSRVLFLVAAVLIGCENSSTGSAREEGSGSATVAGAIYVLTNAAAGNGVAVFNRDADGGLTAMGVTATGGAGTGDLLDSQGALLLSGDRRFLYAVNAGSDQISALSVQASGLTSLQTIPSGGDRPVSLTARNGYLYALNAGSPGNITGFSIAADGRLTLLAGATQSLSVTDFIPCSAFPFRRGGGGNCNVAGPGQVQFNPAGTLLVVTERLLNQFSTYPVASNGVAGSRRSQRGGGESPLGFAFDSRGRFFVAESAEDRSGEGAASSLTLSAVSDIAVLTRSLPNRQTASCCLVITPDERFSYISNPISGTITGYQVGADGSLALLSANGISATTGGDPRDVTVSGDGRFLYALNSRATSIAAFRIGATGSLSPLARTFGFPTNAAGLAGH